MHDQPPPKSSLRHISMAAANAPVKFQSAKYVFWFSRSIEKHLFKTNNEVLIFLDSVRRSPIFKIVLSRSEPAKLQNEMLLMTAVLGFSMFSILNNFNVKMQCERLKIYLNSCLQFLNCFFQETLSLYDSSADWINTRVRFFT